MLSPELVKDTIRTQAASRTHLAIALQELMYIEETVAVLLTAPEVSLRLSDFQLMQTRMRNARRAAHTAVERLALAQEALNALEAARKEGEPG